MSLVSSGGLKNVSCETLIKLNQYIYFILKYNLKINLVSFKSISEFLVKHILDSISLIEKIDLRKYKLIGDIGSGAGLPAIPLSILYPHIKFVLVEPKQKYVRFLKTCVNHLQLKNVIVIKDYIENLSFQKFKFDLIISRAVGNVGEVINLVEKYFYKNVDILLLKGPALFKEIKECGKPIYIKEIFVSNLLEKYNLTHYILVLKNGKNNCNS